MKKALIYVRTSLDMTGEGSSVARQEEACRALCLARGWQVVGVERDNSISAYSGKSRPAWERTLEAVEGRKVDIVVAWHMDRMTRSMLELERLIVLAEQTGVGVATATGDIDLTTDTGRMVARILSAVARAEVERKGARAKLANAQRAAQGKPITNGIRPFGYTRDGMQVVEAEAALIRDAANRVLRGEPLASVARRWTASGHLSPWGKKGKGWSSTGVKGVLTAPRVAGQRMYLGSIVGPGQWPAILDEDTFLAVETTLSDPSRRVRQGGGRAPESLLSGIATCGECGGPIKAAKNRKIPVYRCGDKACASAPRDEVDLAVTAEVIARLSQPDAMASLMPTGSPEVDAAREQVKALRDRKKGLAQSFAKGAIDQEQMESGTEAIDAEIATFKGIIEAAGEADSMADFLGDEDDVYAAWSGASLFQQRSLVRAGLTVVVHPRTSERNGANIVVAHKRPALAGAGL
jgi:DNA invertase Pin-like site-specific DNA recombinase